MTTTSIDRQPASPAEVRKARRTLLIIFLIFLAPVVAGYAAFYLWQPSSRSNYGELITPPQQLWQAAQADTGLRGKWVMLVVAPSQCDDACRQQLWLTRQLRTAQGKDMDRIARAWLVTDTGSVDAALLAEHPGLVRLQGMPEVAERLQGGRIGLVDPRGYLMMRYPAQPDAKRMMRDFERLLKYVQAG